MKKIYVLLLSLGIVTITSDAVAMMRQLLRVLPKNISKKNILPRRFSTPQINSQSKINETDNSFHVLELVRHIINLQDLLSDDNRMFDLYKSGRRRPSPWHYHYFRGKPSDLSGKPSVADINEWSNQTRKTYELPNEFCNDIEQTLGKPLPLWLNKEKIREFNNKGIKFVEKNRHLINDHNNFLLQRREALLILESEKSLYYTIFGPFIKKHMNITLNKKTEQLNYELQRNNRLIAQNIRAIESNLLGAIYDEKEKRQKIASE